MANVSPSVMTFLFEAANFILLACALGWLFFRPVRQALVDRQTRLSTEAQLASEKLAEAERTQKEIDAARAELELELEKTRQEESASARKRAEALIAEARETVRRELEEGQVQLARLNDTEEERLAHSAAMAAADTLAQLLNQIDGPELQSALVRSACEQLKALQPSNLLPVTVESCGPLSNHDREQLEGALGAAAAEVNYQIRPELGAGIRIETNQGLVDASAMGLAEFARRALVQHLANHSGNHSAEQHQ